MVSVHCMFIGIFAFALARVGASPLESSPYTPLDGQNVLNPQHPAFGAELKNPVAPVIPKIKNTTTSSDANLEEMILSYDLQNLEYYYQVRFERNINNLPKSAEIKPIPWPGSYWPTYADGINYRQRSGEASPAEKYAQAFGLNVKRFTDMISQTSGILSQTGRQTCRRNADCSYLNDGSGCAIRRGENSGYCIPKWFGICHAWAPAAILEPEPRCSVVKNGVTFRPSDIKALITQLYDGAGLGSVFAGARYDGIENAATDVYGRFADAAYRDLNPGLFHVALTNILGRYGQSFVVDATAGPEVWNQPLRSYDILEQYSYTLQEAGRQFYRTTAYPFNNYAAYVVYVRARVRWIVEAEEDGGLVSNGRVEQYTASQEYTYLLEVDSGGNVIGGEWLYNSNKDHPDFMWFSTGRPRMDTVTRVGLSYQNVRQLLDQATQC